MRMKVIIGKDGTTTHEIADDGLEDALSDENLAARLSDPELLEHSGRVLGVVAALIRRLRRAESSPALEEALALVWESACAALLVDIASRLGDVTRSDYSAAIAGARRVLGETIDPTKGARVPGGVYSAMVREIARRARVDFNNSPEAENEELVLGRTCDRITAVAGRRPTEGLVRSVLHSRGGGRTKADETRPTQAEALHDLLQDLGLASNSFDSGVKSAYRHREVKKKT